MNWNEAVEAMRRGALVQRSAEQHQKRVDENVFVVGGEPCMLSHAWTADEQPAMVFRGAWSKELFVPDSDSRGATDWVVVA